MSRRKKYAPPEFKKGSVILIHICCAPCCTHPMDLIKELGGEPVGFFFNPNIYPDEERILRMKEARSYCEAKGYQFIAGRNAVDQWQRAVRGMEEYREGGPRCSVCYRFRLEETSRVAREKGIPYFTTTLSISPHKNSPVIFHIGEEAGGTSFLPFDFKKGEGFKKSCDMSREADLYRQDYCGCEYSIRT